MKSAIEDNVIANPNFGAVSALQEKQLHAKLLMARALIAHPAEKGRSLEVEVAAVVRELLPAEYGVGTGFVAYHEEGTAKLSPQLDIIIFDALRSGPISRLAGCEIYPIEAVYAYIEVKASVDFASWKDEKTQDDSLQHCLLLNSGLRKLTARSYLEPTPPIGVQRVPGTTMPIRAFVFAFEAAGSHEPRELAQRMSNLAEQCGAHIHGVLILDRVYLQSKAVDVKTARPEDHHHVLFSASSPFTTFRTHLLSALGSFPRPQSRWSTDWERYFADAPDWAEVAPNV